MYFGEAVGDQGQITQLVVGVTRPIQHSGAFCGLEKVFANCSHNSVDGTTVFTQPPISFASLYTLTLQNGVDVKTVSSMLGHYSAGFTLDTYAHVTTDAQLKAAQTMGNILSCAV